MAKHNTDIPIPTLHLFPLLDKELISLLRSLSTKEWNMPTIAKLWTVKDIASHLLDGNLRTISYYRDNYMVAASSINSYAELVQCLNGLNMSWTSATRRVSPQLLVELLESTGKQYLDQLQKLDPFEDAIFPVAWAGQERSPNWFHIAREYTEKFIHQQQIRDAVGKEGILTRELFYPFIDTFMYALPHAYKDTAAATGTIVQVKVDDGIGGEWRIEKLETGWAFTKRKDRPAAEVFIPPVIAWKLFSKGITAQEAFTKVKITGDVQLGAVTLQMIAVMA
jgi:uncharacterized protein (TIGR03083 family)